MLLFLSMLESEEEKNCFQAVYEKYSHFLWYLAYEVLGDGQLAEDAVQEAFLALTRHMNKILDQGSKATRNFLSTIVRHKAIDLLRKEKGIQTVPFEEWDKPSGEDLLEKYLHRESAEHIRQALDEMEEESRILLEYRYLHGMSEREVAKIMGITPKNANVRIFRARRKLQELLRRKEGIL